MTPNAFTMVRPRGETPTPKPSKVRTLRPGPAMALDVNGRPVVSLERRQSITISSREQSAAQLAKSRKISLRSV